MVSMPPAFANHTHRAEWETHGGADNIGGLRSTTKVQSLGVTSCVNAAMPCTHTMVYTYQVGKGFIGAGWHKWKNAAGTVQLYGLVHYRDYAYANGFYIQTKDLTSKVGLSPWFEASKSDYSSTSSCWTAWTGGWGESNCFNDFKWGHPRIVGRTNDGTVTFGTGVGTYTNVMNRAQTSNSWIEMGSSHNGDTYCIDTSYTDIHTHQNANGFYSFHIGPPFTGESNSCPGNAIWPNDLGG